MGMAASQARFLGLTARKSNVEYQGQQVNQQRTALANESAGLYNQMMTLNVPTPPATTDYYTTTYELENSSASYSEENYTFQNAVKTYVHENEYSITLINKKENVQSVNYLASIGTITNKDETKGDETYKVYTIPLTVGAGSGVLNKLTYNETDESIFDDENKQKALTAFQIYKADSSLTGYNECCEKDKEYYFYQDRKGKNHFILKTDLFECDEESGNIKKDDAGLIKFQTKDFYEQYANVVTKEQQQTVIGTMEKSSTGRFSSLTIDNDEKYPAELAGITFNLSVKQVFNQQGYDDAMNDYKYQKDVYEQAVSDINAKTEIIQRQDQNLELRLDQLDTEQNAINTELDAVKKVLKDNVDKTFKTFNA